MRKFLLILILLVNSAQAVKLCKKEDPCRAIDNWKNASGNIGSYTYTSGSSGTWNLSVTSSPTGTVAGESGCFSGSTSVSGSGGYCWCRVMNVNSSSCSGGWVFLSINSDNNCAVYCASLCGGCARNGSSSSCSRSALFVTTSSDATSVICPLNGTCANTNYKTIGNSDSCGSGWVETTSPALTITGTYSDDAGTFTYDECSPL